MQKKHAIKIGCLFLLIYLYCNALGGQIFDVNQLTHGTKSYHFISPGIEFDSSGDHHILYSEYRDTILFYKEGDYDEIIIDQTSPPIRIWDYALVIDKNGKIHIFYTLVEIISDVDHQMISQEYQLLYTNNKEGNFNSLRNFVSVKLEC